VAAFGLGAALLLPSRATSRTNGQPDTTEHIYLRDCAVCHGADGRGTNAGPTLFHVGRASLDYWLSTGRMPLYANTPRVPGPRRVERPLPGQQLADPNATPRRQRPAYPQPVIDALINYVYDLTGGDGLGIPPLHPASANLADGGELFRQQCAACHAWAGDGGALLHREAPSLHDGTTMQIAEAIRIGPGAMPAFGGAALTDAQLNDLVAYVRYLDNPEDRGGEPLWHLGPVAEGGIAWVFGLGILLVAVRWMGESS